MSRAALRIAMLAVLAAPAAAIDPHLDGALIPGSCSSCHQGHGVSRSPMLPAAQVEVCLSCHGSKAGVDRRVLEGALSPEARPALMSRVLSQAFVHPLSTEALSRRGAEAVTCSSCHAPHRGAPEDTSTGRRRASPRQQGQLEFELCQSCHGSAGVTTQSLLDLSRLTNPNNRSYHPIEGPAREPSPSVLPELAGREVNCTDCHGNSDPDGPRGPHGSAVRYILRRDYATVDGSEESAVAYGLCYSCHDRAAVLDASPFPGHRLHVVDQRLSCASCHAAHGSVENRALIRFGEETFLASVGPSASTGRLAFVSLGAGSGTCFLTCHGVDHGPATYGGLNDGLETGVLDAALGLAPGLDPDRAGTGRRGKPRRSIKDQR